MSFVDFVSGMSRRAGWNAIVPINATLLYLPFDTDEGEIRVFIQPCGSVEGKTVLEFSSPRFQLPDGPARLGLLELLMERNGTSIQGHWGFEGSGEERGVAVMVTQIAETMDPPEFKLAVLAVLREFGWLKETIRKAGQRSLDF